MTIDQLKKEIRKIKGWRKYDRFSHFPTREEAKNMAEYLMPTHTQKGLSYSDFGIRKNKVAKKLLKRYGMRNVKPSYSIWFKETGN